MKRILLTGGSGFIGSHLLAKLIRNNTCLDCRVDVRDSTAIEKTILEFKPELVYHLASYGNQPDHTDIYRIYDVNVIGTANLASFLPPDVPMILASSSSVYGFRTTPMKEDDQPNPNSHYAMSKIAAEYIVKQRHGTILRLFSVYGPGEKEYRLIPTLKRNLLTNKDFETADPNANRDFVHVNDVVEAFVHFSTEVGTFNVGSGRNWKVSDVYSMAKAFLNSSSNAFCRIQNKELKRIWESEVWVADISRAKDFGWESKISFPQGLSEYLK